METFRYLVRHGKYNRQSSQRDLTPEGISESEGARDVLIGRGIGSSALLLCSNTKRTLQTAEIIADGLGVEVHPSTRINCGGNNADAVKDLDEFLAITLDRNGLVLEDDQPLVVVTHAPLIAVAQFGSTFNSDKDIMHGGVYEYTPGTWRNTDYLDFLEVLYSADLAGQ